MATTSGDDGFHEIQLNGKQLVFLFMAVTVVSVVIFLCGVLVGRGVRPELADASALQAAEPAIDAASVAPQGSGSRPATATEKLTYPDRLAGAQPPSEALSPSAGGAPNKPAPPAAAEPTDPAVSADAGSPASPPPSSPDAPPPRSSAAAAAALPPEPVGPGFAIQVTALRERSEAENLVRRLSGKGYSAYVVPPAAGTPAVYRVRVGKFKERREAESTAARLQKEEQFKPWIVR
jgi:cell division septation protein DedD